MIDFDNSQARINEIFYLLTSRGSGAYYGEEVTQLEHALQAAHHAVNTTDSEEIILAALLHDIGHLLEEEEPLGHQDHDRLGGAYLNKMGFSDTLIQLVTNHVKAKRYLVATDLNYRDKLSEASKQTLVLQGGPMTKEEVEAFEAEEYFDDMILIRLCDEQAKDPQMQVMGLEHYRPMLERHLKQNQENYTYAKDN